MLEFLKGSRRAGIDRVATDRDQKGWSEYAAYRPDLLPPLELMEREQVRVLEDWFAWADEWRTLLRLYGGLKNSSIVLEIGCGLGRIAYALRDYLVLGGGRFHGFDICKYKITFLHNTFEPHFPNFKFTHVDVHNTTYNPGGKIKASQFTFPYENEGFGIVYAASVFTHMLPENVERYFHEAARVLRPGGRCVFSFFLMDYYRPGQARPFSFNLPYFNLDHYFDRYGRDFATAQPDNPEDMTGFRSSWLESKGRDAGLFIVHPILPGLWSGSHDSWVGAQDIIIFEKH